MNTHLAVHLLALTQVVFQEAGALAGVALVHRHRDGIALVHHRVQLELRALDQTEYDAVARKIHSEQSQYESSVTSI